MVTRKAKNALSLRLVLIVPYVVLVVALALAIGTLSYRAGAQAISTISDKLLLETVGRITQAIDRQIIGSGAVLESAFPDGMAAPPSIEADLDNLRTRFWIATSLHIDPNNYVYYGNETGQGLGLYRHSLEEGELRMKLQSQERRAIYHFEGIDGPLNFVRREDRLFDPRSRPWYADGRDQPGHTWTSVYIDFGTRELVATRARRVLSAEGQFEGVVATDVSLKALNDFVSQLKVSPNGMAYIIEPDGRLIASSASPNVFQRDDGSYERVSGVDSGNPLLTQTFKAIMRVLEKDGLPGSARVLTLEDAEPEAIHVAFDRIRDDAGLEWITVVAVPGSDFMAGITENVTRTTLLASFAVLLTVGIGLGILGWVAGDLKRLKDAAHKVGDGELDAPVGITRRDEIGELARSFEHMQHRLQTDELTGLINRDAFTRRLDRRILACRTDRRRHRIAVLFIDLNRFKRINDDFGHDAGDKALTEVSLRLKESVRTEDLVARYAGDEFVVMLENVEDGDNVHRVQQNIEAVLSKPLESVRSDQLVSVGAAVGAAIFPDDGEDAATLLKHADRNMYINKFSERRKAVMPEPGRDG